MLSRPIVNASTILKNNSLSHESYVEQYARDDDFKYVYEELTHGNQCEELDFHVHDNLIYNIGKLCVPKDERESVIKESHTFLISGHFGLGNTVAQLNIYCY